MMEESVEYTCDLCKISYTAETELKEHVFSLMHHIKMEKKQKGVTHHCSLCLTSCSNIIEYGKHLNEDKHKQSVEKSRRALDDGPNPKSTDLDFLRDKDDKNRGNLEDSPMDFSPVRPKFQIPEPSSKNHLNGSHNSSSSRGRLNLIKHQRSFSQPEIKSKGNGIEVPRGKRNEDFCNDFDYHDNQGQSMDDGYFSGQFPRGVQPDFDNINWHNVNFIDYEHFDARKQFHSQSENISANHPHWYEDNIAQEFYTDFQKDDSDHLREKERFHQHFNERDSSSNRDSHFRRQDQLNHGRPMSSHLHGVGRENGEEFLGEGRVNIREAGLADRKEPESVIQQATTNFPYDGPIEDHAPKRRRHDDEVIAGNKSRKGNRNEKMDFRPSSRPLSVVTSEHHATSLNRERHESPVKEDISLSLRNSSGDIVKNSGQKRESKSRRSSIDEHKSLPLSFNESLQSSRISSLQSSTMSSLDSSGIGDSGFVSSPKPVKGKRKDSIVGKSQGSKKSAAEKSKDGSKKSPGHNMEENAETVLERAERLCKDLRDKREIAKKERDLKEKQKKLEKHQELNSQLEALSSKNMENIKGHLNSESLEISTSSHFSRSLPSRLADSDCSLTGQGDTKQLSSTGSLSGLLNSRSDLDSLVSSGSKQKEDIDRIRQNIENSVRGGSSSPVARSANTPSNWPTSPISPVPVPNTLAKTKILDKEHLCKLVNTPRSHKERLQLAQLLRTYASTRNKLSLPRFNLQLSGIYDKQEIRTEDLCLENLSPDVQLQIAQIIESDAKPNLQELESILNFGFLPIGTSLSGNLKPAAVMEQLAASPTKEPNMALKHHADVCSTLDLQRGMPNQSSPFPSKVEPRDAISPSPSKMDMETSPAMTLQDLATDVSKSKQSALTSPDSGLSRRPFSPLRSTFPERNRPMRVTSPDQDLAARITEAGKGSTEQTLSSVVIKPEKVDSDYDVGLNNDTSIKTERPDDIPASSYSEMSPVRDRSHGLLRRATVKDIFSASMSPLNHPVSRVTIQQNDQEERPVRDISSPYVMPTLSSTPGVGLAVKSRHPLPSTTHQISSTITDVPAIYSSSSEKEREDKFQTIATTSKTCPELDTRMETRSVVSQESGNSVLDQVYQLSLREEEIRKEIDASDHRMSQLRRLITEATNQLEKYTQKREMLLKEEVQLRNKRMKLLHESRSSQGSTTGPLQGMDSLGLNSPTLSRPQTENYDNPMLMKYLMSQRQHQFEIASSVDGFSGVESGSQAELEKDPTQCEVNLGDRRGSFTSDISSVTQDEKHIGASTVPGKTFKKEDSQLKFEQQSIHPSGAVDLMTDQSLEILSGSSTCSIHSSKPPAVESLRKDLEKKTSEEGTSNPQLALAGFVTLDSLLKNNAEIGKVFQKSLKGKDFSMVLSPTSTVGPKKGALSEQNKIKHNKEQAKELLSDDCVVHSGSDVEKPLKAPMISMKYMGSLQSEGLDTETLRQQIIGESKSSKQLTYTLLTSHDALEQLKKLSSESGMGTSVSLTQSQTVSHTTTVDTAKIITRRDPKGAQHADNDSNLDCLSIVSACSLGEKIKQICDSHAKYEDNLSQEPSGDTPRSGSQSDPDKTLVEEDLDKNLEERGSSASAGIVKDCFVLLDRLDVDCSKPILVSELEARSSKFKKPKSHSVDLGKAQSGHNRARTPSPMRKKLKTKRERDTQSRRKKKEDFILESSSDVNSAEEEDVMSRSGDSGQKLGCEGQKDVTLSRAPGNVPTEGNMGLEMTMKKSLLDEVELETPTDSTDETGVTLQLNRSDLIRDNNKLRVRPEVLKSFRAAVRNNLQSKSDSSVSQASPSAIQYKGPNLPVAAIQVFRGDLYVCYHGSELRRFHLQTGECLKELDCSPFFVNCLHVTQASETQNVLYTGGKCKKLMLFRPETFDILQSHDYDDQIKCLHQNWGRLYIGLSDGVVAIRSIKEDKKLDTFQCTDQPVCCMSTTSAGMTKLLCCGTADSLIYICDAMSGILLTMLHGHKRPPVCIKAFDQTVISGSLDSMLLAHNVNTGALEQSCSVHPDAVTDIGLDDKYIYTSCADKYIRCFDRKTWKLTKTCDGAGRRPLTVINVTDRLVITGNIDGLVEAVPLNKLDMQAVNNEPTSSTTQKMSLELS
ncbi:hypothetical protein CHS0354_004317 [Potamilus streckersoni]|uniref:C2H2-type domain-containing protein n=1 Tax=Potamilus streckersoni TaxID=2493646 RepID=A0AAE0VV70_9BIVA|nr:hypothetical protein CHS0354_004317 [Potamilus streckersoni]